MYDVRGVRSPSRVYYTAVWKGKIMDQMVKMPGINFKFKPCPFCGGRNLELRYAHVITVECNDCGAVVSFARKASVCGVAGHWNDRANSE